MSGRRSQYRVYMTTQSVCSVAMWYCLVEVHDIYPTWKREEDPAPSWAWEDRCSFLQRWGSPFSGTPSSEKHLPQRLEPMGYDRMGRKSEHRACPHQWQQPPWSSTYSAFLGWVIYPLTLSEFQSIPHRLTKMAENRHPLAEAGFPCLWHPPSPTDACH